MRPYYQIIFTSTLMFAGCGDRGDSRKSIEPAEGSGAPTAEARRLDTFSTSVEYTDTNLVIQHQYNQQCSENPCDALREGETFELVGNGTFTVGSAFDFSFSRDVTDKSDFSIIYTSRKPSKNPLIRFADDTKKTSWPAVENFKFFEDGFYPEPGQTISKGSVPEFFSKFTHHSLPASVFMRRSLTLTSGSVSKTYYNNWLVISDHPNSESPPDLSEFPNGDLTIDFSQSLGPSGTSQTGAFSKVDIQITVRLAD